IDSSIAKEQAFEQMQEKNIEYSITEAESQEQNAYLSYNAVIGTNLDSKLYIAFSVLNYVLCLVPGAPIKQALIEKGIGKEVYSTYENGIMQPYFSVVAKGTDEERKEEFCNTIEEVLREQVEKGLNEKALRAGIHYYEFRYREADFGSYPKGLIYGLQLLDSWLYDETKPFIHLEANETYETLKSLVSTRYFEELIEKYLLENHHKSLVTVVPVKGLTAQKEETVAKELEQYKSSLSKEEITKLIKQTKALEDYQEEPNKQEDLEKIPLLTREDIDEFKDPVVNELIEKDGTKYLFHDLFTNKIAYIRLLFNIEHLPAKLLPYVALLKAILGYVDTKNYNYQELAHEIDLQTGGIGTSINSYLDTKDISNYVLNFEMITKVLYDNIPQSFALMEEIIQTSKVEDTKRLYEIVAELRSRMQASMTSSGHTVAAMRAMARFNKVVAISEQTSGVSYYRFIEDLEKNFEAKKEELVRLLKETMTYLFREEQLMVDCIATSEIKEVIVPYTNALKASLYTDAITKEQLEVPLLTKKEGFMTSAQVQYVCRAGNFLQNGLEYTGALRVLRVIMGYEYLWNNVRVKGGAYGCMSSFSKSGAAYFVSYRDPNLAKTIDTYEKAPGFLREFNADERTIMKFIIGAMSDLDAPLTPSTRGNLSLGNYLSHVTTEDMKREREEVLGITREEVERMADYVEAFLESNSLCVVGNEDTIRDNETLFDEIKHLF
ncbi:MAG: insulinase family protein, partial [Eubacteriales bacterium]